MRRRRLVFMGLALLGAFSAMSAHAQKAACPGATRCPVPGFPLGGGQCTISSIPDAALGGGKNRGEWKLSCTNNALGTGDFVWEYDESGAKGVKEIGRCVYFQGRNTSHYIRDPDDPRQVLMYKHTVRNSKNHREVDGVKVSDPGNERTIHLFYKDLNRGLEIREQYDKDTGQWSELERREYESLSIPPTGGTIPRDNQVPEYQTLVRLAGTRVGQHVAEIRWSWRCYDLI